MTFLTRDEAAVGLLGTWMIGPDQISVPVRIGTVIRDFGPNFIWSLFFGPDRLRTDLIGPKLVRSVFSA